MPGVGTHRPDFMDYPRPIANPALPGHLGEKREDDEHFAASEQERSQTQETVRSTPTSWYPLVNDLARQGWRDLKLSWTHHAAPAMDRHGRVKLTCRHLIPDVLCARVSRGPQEAVRGPLFDRCSEPCKLRQARSGPVACAVSHAHPRTDVAPAAACETAQSDHEYLCSLSTLTRPSVLYTHWLVDCASMVLLPS